MTLFALVKELLMAAAEDEMLPPPPKIEAEVDKSEAWDGDVVDLTKFNDGNRLLDFTGFFQSCHYYYITN